MATTIETSDSDTMNVFSYPTENCHNDEAALRRKRSNDVIIFPPAILRLSKLFQEFDFDLELSSLMDNILIRIITPVSFKMDDDDDDEDDDDTTTSEKRLHFDLIRQDARG